MPKVADKNKLINVMGITPGKFGEQTRTNGKIIQDEKTDNFKMPLNIM